MSVAGQAFLGSALHAPNPDELELLSDHVIVVDDAGCITDVQPATTSLGREMAARFREAGRLTRLTRGQFLLPGFVDLHIHAPQWPQLGTCLDLPLEEWLWRYTFPLEARYADIEFARGVYQSLVSSLLANGTTTAIYFATIHLPATQLLAEICLAMGQRALIGRVAMDDPIQCPADYRDRDAATGVAETRAFIDFVRAMPGNDAGLVQPVITPRFIPSCSDALLTGLGALAAETGAPVQTHCSESDWAHHFVRERCGVSDTAALQGFGLLTDRTILAHANFISDDDRALIKSSGAGIAHCPLSNAYFSGAIFPLRQALTAGLKIGLGTDIAGGASPSMLESARHAITASRLLESGVDPALAPASRGVPNSRIGATEAFWLATSGGGMALDMKLGLFREGYAFDAILLDTTVAESDLNLAEDDSAAEMLSKIVYTASRANIRRVWIAGKSVHPVTPPRQPRKSPASA